MLSFPCIKHRFDVLGWDVVPPRAPGDDTTAFGLEGGSKAFDSRIYLLDGAQREYKLAVNFSPKCDLTSVLSPDFFNVHAKELGVYRIDTDIDQVG